MRISGTWAFLAGAAQFECTADDAIDCPHLLEDATDDTFIFPLAPERRCHWNV